MFCILTNLYCYQMSLLQKRTFAHVFPADSDEERTANESDKEDEDAANAWELWKQEKRKPYYADQFAMDRQLHRRIWYKTVHGKVPPRLKQTSFENLPIEWKSRVCVPNVVLQCHCEERDYEFCDESDPSFEFYDPCPLENFTSAAQGHIVDVQVVQDPEDTEMAKVTVQVYFPDVKYDSILYFHEYFPWTWLADPENYLVPVDCCWETYVGNSNDHQYRMQLNDEQQETLEKIVRAKATQL